MSSLRGFLSGLFLTIGVLLVPITLLGQWTQNYLLDTRNFVELYAPLASSETYRDYIASELANSAAAAVEESGAAEITESITGSVDGFFSQFGVELGLEQTASDWASQLADQTGSMVYDEALPALASPQFFAAWSVAVEQVHTQLVEGLLVDGPETQILTLDAAPFGPLIQEYVSDRGIPLIQYLPNLAEGVEIPLVEVTYSPMWRSFVQLVFQYGSWLPWLTAGFLAAGVLLSTRPLATLSKTSFSVAFVAALLWLSSPLLGRWVLSDVGTVAGEAGFATDMWQILTGPLLSQSLTVASIAAAVGVASLLLHLALRAFR